MDYDITVITAEPRTVAVVRGEVPHDGIGAFLGTAFGEVLQAIGSSAVVGAPFARYDLTSTGFTVEAGFPVARGVSPSDRVGVTDLPGGLLATTMHLGPYEGVAAAYAAMEAWLPDHGYAPAGAPWETYLDGPEVESPRTVVSWPCRPV